VTDSTTLPQKPTPLKSPLRASVTVPNPDRRVGMIQELIMDRERNTSFSDVFSARDISILINFLCSY